MARNLWPPACFSLARERLVRHPKLDGSLS